MALEKARDVVGMSTHLMYHKWVETKRYRRHENMQITLESFETEAVRRAGGESFPQNISINISLRRTKMVLEKYTKEIDGQEVELTREVEGDEYFIDDNWPASIDPRDHAYYALKTHDNWKNTKDIFEDGQVSDLELGT